MYLRTAILCLVLAVASPGWAGENPSAKFAMHVVASDAYLGCVDLTPAACESINVDVSAAEILAAGGYGYVAFVAYDVEGITGAEFAITGWPTGRGAPSLSAPDWCPDGALTLGDHLGGGGITSFPCADADENGLLLLAYSSFGPVAEEDLPITLEYAASGFTYPSDPHSYVLDCSVDYEEDVLVATTGCTIGGVHEEQPDCPGELDGGVGEGGTGAAEGPADDSEWPVVVETGTLYVYGNRLDPPYVFTLENDELYVNGVRLSPPLRRGPPPHVVVGDWHRAASALTEETIDMAVSLLERGVPMDSIIAQVSHVYCQSSLVDTVTRARGASIWVHWRDRRDPTKFSFPTSVSPTAPVRDKRSVSVGTAKTLQALLRNSTAVFVGEGYRLTVPRRASQSLLEEMNLLHATQDADAEGLQFIKGCVAEDLLDPLPVVQNH